MYRKHAENDNAPSHSTWKGKRGRKREKYGKQKEREGAREAHRRACLIKVQVQDLSDCQVALSFWFHIDVVSFLPRLSSPALLHSNTTFCCSLLFPSAPLTPRLDRKHGRKVWQRRSALQPRFFTLRDTFLKFWIETTSKLLSDQSHQQHTFQHAAVWQDVTNFWWVS